VTFSLTRGTHSGHSRSRRATILDGKGTGNARSNRFDERVKMQRVLPLQSYKAIERFVSFLFSLLSIVPHLIRCAMGLILRGMAVYAEEMAFPLHNYSRSGRCVSRCFTLMRQRSAVHRFPITLFYPSPLSLRRSFFQHCHPPGTCPRLMLRVHTSAYVAPARRSNTTNTLWPLRLATKSAVCP